MDRSAHIEHVVATPIVSREDVRPVPKHHKLAWSSVIGFSLLEKGDRELAPRCLLLDGQRHTRDGPRQAEAYV